MAVLKNILLAASVLTPLVAAVPMPGLDKRAIYTNTVTEIEWVTVEETTTVWVNLSQPTPAPAATTPAAAVPSDNAGHQPSTLQTLAAAPQAPPTSVPTAAPAVTTSSAAPAPAPVESSSVVPIPAPAASSPSPISLIAPMVTLQPKAAASTDGTCEGSGNACLGDVTHWDGGLGACGWNVNTNSDMEIALPFAYMGTQSNGNPFCGRSVTLFNPATGNTVQATVGDKCMGCVDRAIDCTDALFNAIAPGGDGRVSGIQWWLN